MLSSCFEWIVNRGFLGTYEYNFDILAEKLGPSCFESKTKFGSSGTWSANYNCWDDSFLFELLFFIFNFWQKIINWSCCKWMFLDSFRLIGVFRFWTNVQSQYIIVYASSTFKMKFVLVSFNLFNFFLNKSSLAPLCQRLQLYHNIFIFI